MEDAVAQVKKILKDTTVTEAQVRDTVWNYYFEVDQSVKFLRGECHCHVYTTNHERSWSLFELDQLKKQENKKTPAAKRAAPSKGLLIFSHFMCP
jgi:hypothetical protein